MEPKYSGADSLTTALAPSRLAAAALASAGAGTLALIACLPLEAAVALPAVLWTGLLTLEALGAVAFRRGPRGARAISLSRSGDIVVLEGRGSRRAGMVVAGSFVAPWLTLVRWRPEGAWLDRSVLILPDMLEAEEFRRLRVLLRWR
jgi:toxin CptA